MAILLIRIYALSSGPGVQESFSINVLFLSMILLLLVFLFYVTDYVSIVVPKFKSAFIVFKLAAFSALLRLYYTVKDLYYYACLSSLTS